LLPLQSGCEVLAQVHIDAGVFKLGEKLGYLPPALIFYKVPR
jgi:hypothetical protein